MKYLVILPAYNEQQTIASVIEGIRTEIPFADILVVNDGSDDGTDQAVRLNGCLQVVHPFNLGYGAALQTGFRYATKNGYDYVITMDADGQHIAASARNLIGAMQEQKADIVIGSRFLGGGYRMSLLRRIGSRFFSQIARAYTGITITDPTSGFQLLGRDVFSYLAEGDNYPLDYPDVNIIMALHKKKFRIIETAVRMVASNTGKSMHSGVRPLFYVMKMWLAIIMVLVRRVGR